MNDNNNNKDKNNNNNTTTTTNNNNNNSNNRTKTTTPTTKTKTTITTKILNELDTLSLFHYILSMKDENIKLCGRLCFNKETSYHNDRNLYFEIHEKVDFHNLYILSLFTLV